MTDVKVLKSLTDTETSGVKLLKNQKLTLSLDKRYANSVDLGITKVLASKFMEFEPSLRGVLLNKEDCRNVEVISAVQEDVEYFLVSLEANCFVFSPAPGDHLTVKLQKVGPKYATAQVFENINLLIQKLPSDSNLKTGAKVVIKIVSLAYTKGVPDIIGELVSKQVNGAKQSDTSSVTPSKTPKRKTEESTEKKKKVKKGDDNESMMETTIKTPKKAAMTEAKTPREKLELPAGFQVLEKKTEKKSWKEYQGPDGKRYRSLVEIHRILGGISTAVPATSEADEANNLEEKNIEEESENVMGYWKISEDGSLKKNKNKFYKAEMLKSFPKKSHFYHAENSKSAKKDAMNNISVSMKKKEKSTMEG